MDDERDDIEELLKKALAGVTEEQRAGGRTAAIEAFNRIEAGRRAGIRAVRRRSRARAVALGLGWLAAAAWVFRGVIALSAGEPVSLIPQGATTALETLSALVSVTPIQLAVALALLALATAAGVRLALADD